MATMASRTAPQKEAPRDTEAVATLDDAETLARSAHEGQRDRAGHPVIQHVERVAALVANQDTETRMTAWLHDVVEDTETTLKNLSQRGYGTGVVKAVNLLTRHRDMQTYSDYIDRIARSRNKTAIRVKLADVTDHLKHTPEAINNN